MVAPFAGVFSDPMIGPPSCDLLKYFSYGPAVTEVILATAVHLPKELSRK
jgi:hypothetical protein